MLLAMLPVGAGIDPCASSCSGGSVVCLVPCVRCDVRGAEVQEGWTLCSSLSDVNDDGRDMAAAVSYDYIQLIVLDPVNDRKLGNTIKFPRIVRDQCYAQT